MTRSNIAALVAGLLALVGLALGAYGLYRSANAQNQMTTLQATLAADAAHRDVGNGHCALPQILAYLLERANAALAGVKLTNDDFAAARNVARDAASGATPGP